MGKREWNHKNNLLLCLHKFVYYLHSVNNNLVNAFSLLSSRINNVIVIFKLSFFLKFMYIKMQKVKLKYKNQIIRICIGCWVLYVKPQRFVAIKKLKRIIH